MTTSTAIKNAANGVVPPKDERRKLMDDIRTLSAELNRAAAAVNLATVVDDVRDGWPDAASITVSVDFGENPAWVTLTAIHAAGGRELWPAGATTPNQAPAWKSPTSHAVIAQRLANAYDWEATSLGELVDEQDEVTTYRYDFPASDPVTDAPGEPDRPAAPAEAVARLWELSDEYGHHPDADRGGWHLDPAERFLLVQESVFVRGLNWLATFATQDAASSYVENEESRESWTIVGLFDLHTGARFSALLRPAWEPTPDPM